MSQKQLSEFEKSLCARLKKSREEAKLSYKALESLTGISRSTLQRYETGKSTRITMEKIKLIAKALNVTPYYLMGWESKDLPQEYYNNLLPLLDELDCTITYNEKTDSFSLIYNNNPIPITVDEIKDLKNSMLSYLEFMVKKLL